MTYIDLVNNFWDIDEDWQFTCCETRLYFYLLKTANRLGWVDSWTRSDAKVSSDVGVSVNSMKTARNRLVQAGLIEFKQGGNGQRDKTRYQIRCQFRCQNLTPKPQPKLEPKLEPKPQPKLEPKPIYKERALDKDKDLDKEISLTGDEEKQPDKSPYGNFKEWMKANTPNVLKLQKQVTEEQYKKIREKYSYQQLVDILLAMENYKDLPKKYTSVYLTFLKWAKREYGTD